MLSAVYMAKDIIVIYIAHYKNLILRRLKRYFPYPENQNLTKAVLNFIGALYFWALLHNKSASIFSFPTSDDSRLSLFSRK